MAEYYQTPPEWPPHWPDITDPAVRAAMAAVPRHLFVPEQFREQAYDDIPLPIGLDQTISQPYIVAVMTQALRLTAASRVLEVGTGSGYQAAVLAMITPHVYSIEYRALLAETAALRLQALGFPVHVQVGDGCRGWPEQAPFDGVVVAAAAREVPPALVLQLRDDGRLVIPVGKSPNDQRLWSIRRRGDRIESSALGEVRFVPLMGEPCEAGENENDLEPIRRQLRQQIR